MVHPGDTDHHDDDNDDDSGGLETGRSAARMKSFVLRYQELEKITRLRCFTEDAGALTMKQEDTTLLDARSDLVYHVDFTILVS